MLGELTPEQINAVLFNEVVGRIGCSGEGRTYIVPRETLHGWTR